MRYEAVNLDRTTDISAASGGTEVQLGEGRPHTRESLSF
jgi:hypothetical protein